MKKTNLKKIRITILGAGSSLLFLFCNGLLFVFTPNLWKILIYVILLLSIINIPLVLLSLREIQFIQMSKFKSIAAVLSMLLISFVHAIFSFQAITTGVKSYTGTCDVRVARVSYYNRIITADGQHYDTKNLGLINTLKELKSSNEGNLPFTYQCTKPVTVTYLTGFNYIVSIQIQNK